MSFHGTGPIHLQGETDGSKHEWCRLIQHTGWRVRLTEDRTKVTCKMCLQRLAKQDAGQDITITPGTTKSQRDAIKAAKLWRELNGK
jgi:hypothetical protein